MSLPLLNLSLQIQVETHFFASNKVQVELEFGHFLLFISILGQCKVSLEKRKYILIIPSYYFSRWTSKKQC